MIIAKLTVSLKNIGIGYNSSSELGTDKGRGAVLPEQNPGFKEGLWARI